MAEDEQAHRGLWQLMQRGGAAPVEPDEAEVTGDSLDGDATDGHGDPIEAPPGPDGISAVEPATVESGAPPPDPDDGPAGSPRSLWSVMRTPAVRTDDEEPITDEASAAGKSSVDTDRSPKGLWALMGPPPAQQHTPLQQERIVETELSSAESTDTPLETPPEERDDLEPGPPPEYLELPAPEPSVAAFDELAPPAERSRGAAICVLLGVGAAVSAALALLPEFWVKIPATVLGFGALIIGLQANAEIRRSRGRQRGRGLALAGMTLGIAAMLLAPTVISQYGRNYRREHGRQRTFANLTVVGEALDAYRLNHDHFPPGGTFDKDGQGNERALHGWMTHLLPHIGEDEQQLHQQIVIDQPWNAEVNRRPFARNVPAFFASGADTSYTGAGYAVTHYAGLGGTQQIEGAGLANVGVFSRNSRVAAEDVGDGLSQTLVAGEIGYDFPAWGNPQNWRTIGRGLNKERSSFGNVDRTGAMFLRADGSVKFFSNDVSLEVLQKLSTRNGREHVDEVHYR